MRNTYKVLLYRKSTGSFLELDWLCDRATVAQEIFQITRDYVGWIVQKVEGPGFQHITYPKLVRK